MDQQENLSTEEKSLKKAKILKFLFFVFIILIVVFVALIDYLENYLKEEYLLGMFFFLVFIDWMIHFEIIHILKKGGKAAEKLRGSVSKTWGWGLIIRSITSIAGLIFTLFFFYKYINYILILL